MIRRHYSRLRGLDLRGSCGPEHSPDCRNLWRDRRGVGLVTRPAMELLRGCDGTVWGIWPYGESLLIHSGTKLYLDHRLLWEDLPDGPGVSFQLGSTWYFLGGGRYLYYRQGHRGEVTGFVPTTSISRAPGGGGTLHQDANLLTGRRINTFLADGVSTRYHLDAQQIDMDIAPTVTVNGQAVTDFETDYLAGILTFAQAPEAPLTAGQDNVSVEFSKTDPGSREKITGCTLAQCFDNRVFLSGNPDHPGVLWHCALEDAAYFSDLDYYRDGAGDVAVTALAAGSNALWVFCGQGGMEGAVFRHEPVLDSGYGKVYPASAAGMALGCLGTAATFGSDVVYRSPRGLEGIREGLGHRSSLVDPLLTGLPRQLLCLTWRGYLLLMAGDQVLLADGLTPCSLSGQYEWFHWVLERPVTAAVVWGGVLHLGCADGIYTLTGTGPVDCHWLTAGDDFGHPERMKLPARQGLQVRGSGDLQVSWAQAGGFLPLTGRLPPIPSPRIQLRISGTRLRLEDITAAAHLGRYLRPEDRLLRAFYRDGTLALWDVCALWRSGELALPALTGSYHDQELEVTNG